MSDGYFMFEQLSELTITTHFWLTLNLMQNTEQEWEPRQKL